MNNNIPYSIEDLVNPQIEKDAHEFLKAWGYSEMQIQSFEIWQRRRNG